jgi:hypothetical protein
VSEVCKHTAEGADQRSKAEQKLKRDSSTARPDRNRKARFRKKRARDASLRMTALLCRCAAAEDGYPQVVILSEAKNPSEAKEQERFLGR